jgi:hypothetical protein
VPPSSGPLSLWWKQYEPLKRRVNFESTPLYIPESCHVHTYRIFNLFRFFFPIYLPFSLLCSLQCRLLVCVRLSLYDPVMTMMSMGCDYVPELRLNPERVYSSCPRWYMSMEKHGGMMSAEENFWFVHQRSHSILLAESSGSKQEERAKGMMNLASRSFLFILANYFTCHIILRHGTSGFTSPPKEGMLLISPLKIHRLCRVWTREPWVKRQAR